MSEQGKVGLASMIAGMKLNSETKPESDLDDRLEGLLDEYENASNKKDKARALRAFVRYVGARGE